MEKEAIKWDIVAIGQLIAREFRYGNDDVMALADRIDIIAMNHSLGSMCRECGINAIEHCHDGLCSSCMNDSEVQLTVEDFVRQESSLQFIPEKIDAPKVVFTPEERKRATENMILIGVPSHDFHFDAPPPRQPERR